MKDRIDEMKNFWEETQKIENCKTLSGCQYDETVEFLMVKNILFPKMHVLEIGVGVGYVTKGFFDAGYIVSGMDISEVALKRVEEYCEATYTLDKLNELPSNYFDIIICHNVVQHVPTDILITEFEHFMRALKEDGVFAVEFISSESNVDGGISATQAQVQSGTIYRNPQIMEKIINGVGGKCDMVVNNKIVIGDVIGCHVFHIKNK